MKPDLRLWVNRWSPGVRSLLRRNRLIVRGDQGLEVLLAVGEEPADRELAERTRLEARRCGLNGLTRLGAGTLWHDLA
jgi:hypothetical protein